MQCHTSHLTTFTVLPVVAVSKAKGCAHDVGPTAMHCPSESATASLRFTGVHFGAAAATLQMHGEDALRRWECGQVEHVQGSEDTGLICSGLKLVAGVCW